MMLVTALRWTIDHLLAARADAVRLYPEADASIADQVRAAEALLKTELMAESPAIAPGRQELLAMRREGAPWGAIAEVAEEFLALEASLDDFVARLLMPDDEIRWRLFHLGVLGEFLRQLRRIGCGLTSVRPLGPGSSGPAFLVTAEDGSQWDLWFEASGIWASRGIKSPYAEATAGIAGIDRALGADILLIRGGEAALILECKYSYSREFVARAGYYQAATYATEVASRLASRVVSVAVGPEGVVAHGSLTTTSAGLVGVVPPSALAEALGRVMLPKQPSPSMEATGQRS